VRVRAIVNVRIRRIDRLAMARAVLESMERLQLSACWLGGRTWLGEVRDDADGVGNALEARVPRDDAAVLLRGRCWRRLLHHHVVLLAAALDVLLPHLTRAKHSPRPLAPRTGSSALGSLLPRSSAAAASPPPAMALSGSWPCINKNTGGDDLAEAQC
jgi:hypothetical protein